jgi:hypothetical protein
MALIYSKAFLSTEHTHIQTLTHEIQLIERPDASFFLFPPILYNVNSETKCLSERDLLEVFKDQS